MAAAQENDKNTYTQQNVSSKQENIFINNNHKAAKQFNSSLDVTFIHNR